MVANHKKVDRIKAPNKTKTRKYKQSKKTSLKKLGTDPK